MNVHRRVAFVGWLVFAAATASGCLTTYDTEAEKYVPSEPTNTCTAGAVEVCDGVDNDCNDQVDEGCNDDGDEYCDSSMVVHNDATNTPPAVCPAGGGDCNDTDRDVHPSATDVCDDDDNDCSGAADEGCNDDGDAYCVVGAVVVNNDDGSAPNICPMGAGDCDDDLAEVYPDADEVCDDLDNNCDEATDEGCDDDDDGVCDGAMTVVGTPTICVNGINDCDDNNAAVGGGSDEICDGVDNNCDLATDEGCDDDGDGYCDLTMTVDTSNGVLTVCPLGGGDCLDEGDGAELVYPKDAEERCDDFDDDCDGTVDDLCDLDDDGYCGLSLPLSDPLPAACPLGGDDCDDSRAESYTGAAELCNDLLDACGGVLDDGCNDDGDAYCDLSMTTVGNPVVCSGGGGDCDDARADVYPGAPDACGAADFNCDGVQPELTLSEPVSVRGRSPQGNGEDMAFDGTYHAISWVEDTALNSVARFAILSASGSVTQGPFDLTDPLLGADRTVIAYDSVSARFGVAFSVFDPIQQALVLNLTTFNSAGTILSTAEVGTIAGPDREIRIVAGPGVFGLFYSKELSGTSIIHYRPYTNSSGTLGNEEALLGLPTNAGLYGATIAHFPAAPGNGTFFLGWSHFDSSFTPADGLGVVGVRVDNGSIYPTFRHLQFANSENGYWASIAYLNGKMYGFYRGDANTSTSFGSDYYLRAIEINSAGNFVGAPITLVSNLQGSNPRAVGTEGANRTGNVGIVYVGYGGANGTKTHLARFTSALAPISPPEAAWFGFIYNSYGGYGRDLFFRGREFTFLNTSTLSSSFFTFLGIDFQDVGNVSAGYDKEPITGATFNTEISPNPSLIRYSDANDELRVLQRDPDDFTKLETFRIARNGTVSAPIFLADQPENCETYRLEGENIVCYGFRARFAQSDCYFPATGPALNEYDFVRNEWDGAAWQNTVVGVVPGFFFQDPWDPWFTFCQAPDLLSKVGTSAAGNKTAFINVFTQGSYFPESYIKSFSFAAGVTTSQDVFKFDEATPLYLTSFKTELGPDYHVYFQTVTDPGLDTITVSLASLNTTTGALDGPLLQVAQAANTDTSVQILATHFDGNAFVVVYSIDNTATGVKNQYLQLFDPVTKTLLPSPISVSGFMERQHLDVLGTPDYRVISENSRFGQSIRIFDEAFSPVEQAKLNYTLPNIDTSWLGYNGRDFRWLINGPSGLVSYSLGTCANP